MLPVCSRPGDNFRNNLFGGYFVTEERKTEEQGRKKSPRPAAAKKGPRAPRGKKPVDMPLSHMDEGEVELAQAIENASIAEKERKKAPAKRQTAPKPASGRQHTAGGSGRPAGGAKRQSKSSASRGNQKKLKISFLGGLNEIGKNITVYECDNDMIIVDCGMAFPDGGSFDTLFKQAENDRIIIASFGSNIHRVQQIIDCAQKYGRKVALSGRSMINVVGVAMELGYLDVPDGLLIDINLLNRYPKEQIVLITTGSQGEPMSALTRMAYSDHRRVEVGPDDFIIISANPIPGNEKTVGAVINELLKRGCKVVYESMYEVHVSGHACQEELKIMLGLVKPKYFIPVHGEQKHLKKHAALAHMMGIPNDHVLIADIGKTVELSEKEMKILADVPAGRVLVDGLGVGDVGSIVLRDRKHLAQDGLIVVVTTIDSTNGHVISGPDVVSRGFVYVRESEVLMNAVKARTAKVLDSCANTEIHDWATIKTKIKEELSSLLYEKTKRSPMILPVIMEV